jgi:hypothetical protein
MLLTTLFGVIHETGGDVERSLRFEWLETLPYSTHPLAKPFGLNVGLGQRLLEGRAQAVEIAGHRNIEAADLLTVGIEEEDVGLAGLDADDIGAPRRAYDGIGDRGIGDQHILDLARQVDHHRLADAKWNKAGAAVPRHKLDDRRALLGRGRLPGRDEPEREDHGSNLHGSDQRHIRHDGPLFVRAISMSSR